MAEFHVRSDSVDVEQIMRQIRTRIREKRGVDYTEAELQQLASVKLEKFLDPRGVRSDLVDQFRRHRVVSAAPPNYAFEDTTLYETHRGLLRTIRKLLRPVLKLFFNPDKITSALHIQAGVNEEFHRRFRQREEMDPLFYEVIHNLVLEITRLGIEVHNLTMRVESVSSRLDFDERRGRALEGAVQYRPAAFQRASGREQQTARGGNEGGTVAQAEDGRPETARLSDGRPEGGQSEGGRPEGGRPEGGRPPAGRQDGEPRRRRRRRRRRPGSTLAGEGGASTGAPAPEGGNGHDAYESELETNDGPDTDGPGGDGPDDGADGQ